MLNGAEMRSELLDEAIEMIRAAGFKPRVVRNRHWKIDWVDQHGRRQRLVIALSPSDHRARWQSRATLRKLLRAAKRPASVQTKGGVMIMKDNSDEARRAADADWDAYREYARSNGYPLFNAWDPSSWPPGDGENTLIPVVIGDRGEFSKAKAQKHAMLWRQLTERYPKGAFTILINGYNDDPRQVWEFADARRYVRWWARFAGMDDPKAAARWVGLGSTYAACFPDNESDAAGGFNFLMACGVFGEKWRRERLRIGTDKPTVAS
jgi:hypothetical protein